MVDGSSSTTVIVDGSSTGSGLIEAVGFWSQGYTDSNDETFRQFVPCGVDDNWAIEGVLPDVDACDVERPVYLRVAGELIPQGPEDDRPTLVIAEILEGPCWQHTCDGGDPCTCGTLEDVCPVDTWLECDLYQHDCYEGEKCMPWANDGGSQWNSTRCAPIEDDPGQPGEPCTVAGSPTSGSTIVPSARCAGTSTR